jgi:hypothetical protein
VELLTLQQQSQHRCFDLLTLLLITERPSEKSDPGWHVIFMQFLKNLRGMATNKTLLIALGGAAAAVMIYRYLGTEKGKEALDSASGLLKDLTSKATEFAKKNTGAAQGADQAQPA